MSPPLIFVPFLGVIAVLLIIARMLFFVGPRVAVGRRLWLDPALYVLALEFTAISGSLLVYHYSRGLDRALVEGDMQDSVDGIRAIAMATIAFAALGAVVIPIVFAFALHKLRDALIFFRIPQPMVQQLIRDSLGDVQWRFQERATLTGTEYVLDDGVITVRKLWLNVRVELGPPIDRTRFLTALRARLLADGRNAGLRVLLD